MKGNHIEIKGSELTICSKKAPLFIRLVLTLFMSVLVLIPIALIVFTWLFGEGAIIGIAFSFLFCWGLGFYLLRIILWNSCGREILNLETEKVSYIADYGLFKDGRQEIPSRGLQTEIIYDLETKPMLGRLKLNRKTASLETVLHLSIAELEELINAIERQYQPS